MVNQQTGEVSFVRFGFLDSALFAFDFSVIVILMSLHPLIFLKESFFPKKFHILLVIPKKDHFYSLMDIYGKLH